MTVTLVKFLCDAGVFVRNICYYLIRSTKAACSSLLSHV